MRRNHGTRPYHLLHHLLYVETVRSPAFILLIYLMSVSYANELWGELKRQRVSIKEKNARSAGKRTETPLDIERGEMNDGGNLDYSAVRPFITNSYETPLTLDFAVAAQRARCTLDAQERWQIYAGIFGPGLVQLQRCQVRVCNGDCTCNRLRPSVSRP
jgi:hypothetical protein